MGLRTSRESDLRKQLVATAIGAERDRVRKEQLKVVVSAFSAQKAMRLSRLFAKNDTWQVPTLLVQYTYAYVNPHELHDSPGIRYVPASTVNGWIDRLSSFRKIRDEKDMEAQKRSYQREIQLVQMMRRSGARFMIGTDAETFYPAGFDLHIELGLFVSAGFSSLIIDGERILVKAGEEYFIPRGVPHSGQVLAGTRTIHAFGGHRADRVR